TTMGYDLLGRKIAMSDPDKGDWQYNYNGYGELIQQTDAKGQRVENTYDLLGRLIERRDIDDSGERVKTSQWLYNNTQTTGEGGVPPTALAQVKEFAADPDTISYRKLYSYDELGRPSETVTSLADDGSDDHYEKTNYDAYSRPFQIFDAGGDGSWNNSAIRHHYNQYGYLYQVVDAELLNLATAEQFYTILNMDARGNVTEHLNGNGITTVKTYDPATGRLLGQTASVLGIGDIQQLSYDWDDLGNLTRRQDQSGDKDLSETFRYDELNRLTNAQVAGRQAQTLRYDDLGNITHKSDVGDYSYAGQCANKNYGPHAVCHTSDGVSYDYDANGNMTSDSSGRNLQYTTFDKPDAIKKGDHTTEFKYGPDRKRYLRIDTDSSGSNDKITETRSIGNIEKITKDGTTEIKRHLPGGALITLTVTQKNNETQYGSRTIQYLHKDHLGSLDVITDSGGQIANAGKALYSFDAWGQRRNALSWEALLSAELTGFDTNITTRGYTGHEMLDQVGLIHMNGRIYDPRLARFLQADPFIQTVSDTQMYNRYSYVRNNPLNATDPSGYFIATLAGFIAYAAGANAVVTGIIVGIAAFAETMMNGGNFADALKNGIISGVAAGAFTSMRSGFDFASATWGETAILGLKFGAVGGITSVLQGGKFGHGFVSAGVSAFTGKALGGTKFGASLGRGDQAVSQIVIGGTVSKATGGKFANGAATAAFQAVVAAAASGSRNRPGFTEGGVEVDYSQLESEGDYQLVDDHLASLVGDSSVNQASLAIAGTELGFHYTSARLSATAFTSRDVTSGLMRNAYLRSSRQVAIGGGAVMSFGLMPVSTVSGVAWHALDTHLKGVPMTVEGAAASILIDRTLSPGFEALGRASGHRFGEVMWNINQDILGYGIGQAGP
ncbi:MAG: hypothetical protein K0U59_06995, partial [Gammaproteobacteria bacterium]|nr:hypothetical protein [Gammaproteobacteria bacterium]